VGIGTWGTTTTADGRLAGALAMPALDDAALARVVDTVNRVRAADLVGVLTVIDLVAHANRLWVVTSSPATPALAAAGTMTPPQALRVATETGRTLAALHAAGIVHGALDGSAIVLTADGPRLNEVGLAAAIAGEQREVAADIAAWAQIVARLLPGNPVLSAVATAAAAGLDVALQVLAANASTIADASLPEVEPLSQPASDVPAGAVTLLGHAPAAATPSEDLPTQLGRRRAAEIAAPSDEHRDEARVLRFGPGVPASVTRVAATPLPPLRRRRRLAQFISTVTVLVLVAAAAGHLWRRLYPGLAISTVSVAAVAIDTCDTAADVVAVLQTNGMAGTLVYRWQTHVDGRSPDETSREVRQHIGAGTQTVTLHLAWTFKGPGQATGEVALIVNAPGALTVHAPVSYRCR
jgi:hypothetical protein